MTSMIVRKAGDGRYQAYMSGTRESRIERFINEDGPEDTVRHEVIAGILHILVRPDCVRYDYGRCRTSDERRAAVMQLEEVFDGRELVYMDLKSIGCLLEPPHHVATMMDGLLRTVIAYDEDLDGEDRDYYERNYLVFVLRQYMRACEDVANGSVASFSLNDLMSMVILNYSTSSVKLMSLPRCLRLVDDLKRLGIGVRIGSVAEVMSPRVVLAIKDMEKFNPEFALATRPAHMDMGEALNRLQVMNARARPLISIGTGYLDFAFLTWRTLTHDWSQDESMFLNGGVEYAHAATIMVEDRKVDREKVGMIVDMLFPRATGNAEFDMMNRKVHGSSLSTSSADLRKTLTDIAYRFSDMELLKALAWFNELVMRMTSGSDSNQDYHVAVSREMIQSALSHYNDGLPWTFIIETAKATKLPESDGYSVIIGDVDRNGEESDLSYRVEMRD